MKRIFEGKPIIYLIASIIPLLSISIFLADLICSALAVLFLFYLIKSNFNFVYKNTFFIISIIFYFACVISSIFSDDILFSLKSSLPLIRIIMLLFLLSYLITFNKDLIDVFYNFIKVTFLILILSGFVDYFYQYYLLVNQGVVDLYGSYIRLDLFFLTSDEEKLGSFLVRIYGLFLALHIVKKNKSKNQNVFFFILTLLTAIIILLSGERTSLFFMILFSFICLILLNIKFKIKLILLTLISTCFFLLLFLNTNLSHRIIGDKGNQFSFSKDEVIIFTPAHTAHYKTALKMFLDKPYLGHGPKMFRRICSDEKYNIKEYSGSANYIKHNVFSGCATHPHNTYVQLLAETGIIGTILFTSGFIYITYTLLKHFLMLIFYRKRYLVDYQIVLSATVLITFWPFSPSGNFFNNWMLIVYSIPLGFYINEFWRFKW